LSAAYHLDKETKTKSGEINLVTITADHKLECVKLIEFDFGVLSIKQEDHDQFSLGCSDGKLRFYNFAKNEVTEITNSEDDNICILHHASNSKFFSTGSNTAELSIYAREDNKLIWN